MDTDQELRSSLDRLHTIAKNHSRNEYDDSEIDEASRILTLILVYAHKMSQVRSVQIAQIEDNISEIRKILNQQYVEGTFPNISHPIDNLAKYCGVTI